MSRGVGHFTDKKGKSRRGAKPGNKHTAKGPRIGRGRADLPPKTKPADAPKGPPRGKAFAPGRNGHTDEVFRRGEDNLPRGSVTLMFRCILHDEREALYRAIVRKIRRSGTYALHFLEKAGNRIEGLPVRKVETSGQHFGAVFVFSTPDGRQGPATPSRQLVGAGNSPAASELSAADALILGLDHGNGAAKA